MTTIEKQLELLKWMTNPHDFSQPLGNTTEIINDIASTVAAVKNLEEATERLKKENDELLSSKEIVIQSMNGELKEENENLKIMDGLLRKDREEYVDIISHLTVGGIPSYATIVQEQLDASRLMQEKLKSAIKSLLPMAKEYYKKISKKSLGHEEFIKDDADDIAKAEELLSMNPYLLD